MRIQALGRLQPMSKNGDLQAAALRTHGFESPSEAASSCDVLLAEHRHLIFTYQKQKPSLASHLPRPLAGLANSALRSCP